MTVELGQRLESAIRQRGSVVAFAGELNELGIRGASRPSIYSYVRGDVTPSDEFLRATAAITGVRLVWLKYGHGEVTAEAQENAEIQARIAAEQWEIMRRGRLSNDEAWMEGLLLGEFPDYENLSDLSRALVFRTCRRVRSWAVSLVQRERMDAGRALLDREGLRPIEEDATVGLGRALGSFVGELARGGGGDRTGGGSLYIPGQLEDFAALACQAAVALIQPKYVSGGLDPERPHFIDYTPY